ncbi:hypothetical protein J3E72DRAFT_374571 [Bipolaris maydis]|nr:hypothetical protein BM1_08304 [Bipolaris maydis]KAJ5061444.1 hypothetical protein J3E74DRAFT_406297 [Bipolaris maydis]KAJ6198572.1 hypothetical protein J3E72DRAFT_374571 [Bipolaris maydis]KAJ6282148.1 hypothetical protein J3E71DRAFT_241086 [Bipolaris maydis]
MVFHKVISCLVIDDFFFTLQCLQVVLAGCGLFHADGYQFRVKQCLKILLAISVSGYPKQLLPEPLYQLQQGGLAEDVGDGNSMLPQHLQAHQEVEEALRDDLIDYAADQVTTEQLNELDMSDNAIDIGFWGDLLEISASVPFEKC